MTWGSELADVCTKAKAKYGRGPLAFGDVGINESQLQELLEFISSRYPGFLLTGKLKARSYRGDEDLILDFDAEATSIWLRFFNWRNEGWCVEIHIDRGEVMEEYLISFYGNEESLPTLEAGYYIHAYAEMGYDGSPAGSREMTPEQALDFIRLIRSMTGVDDG